MNKKIINNYLWQVSYNLLVILLPIITIPIISRALGPKGVGTYNYVSSIVSYFTLLAGLGIATYGVREISLVRHNKSLLTKTFWELAIFNFIFSSISLCVFIIISFFLKQRIFFLSQSLVVLAAMFDITWFFAGLEDFKKISLRNFTIKIISFIVVVLFVNDEGDLLLYFYIQALSILLSQISLCFFLKNKICFKIPKNIKILRHFKPSLSFFITKISTTIYVNGTKTILGKLGTMVAVGFFSNSFTLIVMVSSILTTMNTVMIPRLSELSKVNREKFENLFFFSIHLQLYFTIAFMFGIIATTPNFVVWFFGTKFLELKSIIPLVAPVIVFQNMQAAIGNQYCVPQKKMKEYNFATFGGACVALLISLFTIPFLGVYGAVLAINICYIYIFLIMVIHLYKSTNFRFQYRKIISWFFCGLLMYIIVSLFNSFFYSAVLNTMSQVLIGIIVYFLSTSILKCNPMIDTYIEMKNKK